MAHLHELILSRLMQLDSAACIRLKVQESPRTNCWYVDCGNIILFNINDNSIDSLNYGAISPEQALEITWRTIVELMKDKQWYIMRYFGGQNTIERVSFVQWDSLNECWIDVAPRNNTFYKRGISHVQVVPLQNIETL